MQKLALILKELSIQKISGFPEGMKSYKDFASNINIIAGPNASGKSSTARIIKKLIWPDNTNGIFAESSAKIENENWDVKIHSKNIIVQREGLDDRFPGLPAIESSYRYDLALHELVKDEDEDIATEIIRQSSGGYNLDEAQINLRFSNKIKDKGAKEYKEFKEAKRHQDESERIQKGLQKEEEKLNDLYEKSDKAKEALGLKDLYEKLSAYLQSKITFNLVSKKYHNYPAVMNKLSGNEYTDIKGFQNEIDETDKGIENAKNKINEYDEKQSKLDLPKDGVSDDKINELNERIERISDHLRNINDTEHKIEELKTKEIEALKSIDESINPEKWDGLNLKNLSGLDQFLQSAHKTRSEKQFLETEINELKKEITEKNLNAEVLNEGIRSLSFWLQEQTSTSGISKWWTIALALVSVLTAILIFFIGWPGLIGIAFIIILVALPYWTKSGTDNNISKNDYNKTSLPQPKIWSIKGVNEKLNEIINELNEVKWQAKINQKIDNYTLEIENLQPQLNKINETRDTWLKDINALPELPSTDLKNYTELYWFLDKVNKWQTAHTKYKVSIGEKNQFSNSLSEDLEKLNQLFNSFNCQKAKDDIEAKSIFNKLKKSENIRREALAEIKRLKTKIDEDNGKKDSFLKKIEEIYKILNISIGEKEEIRKLIERLEEYKETKEAYQVARRFMDEKESLLTAHSLYAKNKEKITSISLDQAEILMKEFEDDASKSELINSKITEIQTNINNAKGSHLLEDAISRQDESLNNLEQLYEENLSSLTGNLIINQLKEKSRKQNQPKVLIRANELFNNITSGRYHLLIEDKNTSALRAYDNVLKLGQDLSELSTGTRIQLLLSVRIAFIEMQEGIIKLPILADELLANSDDIRAKAIIEALIKISKEGRQVFYFTAQADEVSKWKSYLNNDKDISFKIFELTGGKNETLTHKNDKVEFSALNIIQDIPLAKNKSHEEYGEILHVPTFNILGQETEQLHIWYLTTDNELIFNCLKKGIRKWGQLSSFIENNGKVEGLDEESMKIFHEKISLIERFIELYRRGRPRPIDREVLEKSDAVSDNFIEEVNSKLTMLNGDPIKLIEALKNGEVNKFRTNKSEELEQFILNEGYIDNYEALEKDEILIQLNALLSNMSLENTEAQNIINNILHPGL